MSRAAMHLALRRLLRFLFAASTPLWAVRPGEFSRR